MKDDKFFNHKLTGFPSWYLTDFPVDVDASFPLAGYITKTLPHPHAEWKSDFSIFSEKLAKKNAPSVPFAVRLASLTVGDALRRLLAVFLVVAVLSYGVGSGIGFFLVPVEQETAVSVPVSAGLKVRSGGGSDLGLLDDCYDRFSMVHGRFVQVCY